MKTLTWVAWKQSNGSTISREHAVNELVSRETLCGVLIPDNAFDVGSEDDPFSATEYTNLRCKVCERKA